MKILGYSQSSSKPLNLDEIDSLNKEGFNAFCIESGDIPFIKDEKWEDTAKRYLERYYAIKSLGDIKLIKVNIGCLPEHYGWSLEIIRAFAQRGIDDVCFYIDEPLNVVESGQYGIDSVRKSLYAISSYIKSFFDNKLIVGIQKRLYWKAVTAFDLTNISYTYSTYLFANGGSEHRFIYGNFCYWHSWESLWYKKRKKKAVSDGIQIVWLYQGETNWYETFLDRWNRKRFIKIFGE